MSRNGNKINKKDVKIMQKFLNIIQSFSLFMSAALGWLFFFVAGASIVAFLLCLSVGCNFAFSFLPRHLLGVVVLLSAISFFVFQKTNFSKKQKIIFISFCSLFLIYFIFSFFEIVVKERIAPVLGVTFDMLHFEGLFNSSVGLVFVLFITWYIFHISFLSLYFKKNAVSDQPKKFSFFYIMLVSAVCMVAPLLFEILFFLTHLF